MMINRSIIIFTLGLILSACTDVNKSNNVAELAAVCLSSSNMGQALCDCITTKADQELSPASFAFFLASMQKDKEKVKQIGRTLELTEMTSATSFMLKGPASCAKDLAEQ